MSCSKRLSYRKKELEVADVLHLALRRPRRWGRAWILADVDEVLRSPLESEEIRRIDAVAQIHPDGADGGAVAEAESHRMDHVVEILQAVLTRAERQVGGGGIHVAQVM